MAKDLQNVVTITNGDIKEALAALRAGKTVEIAVEHGMSVSESLRKGYLDYIDARMELVCKGEEDLGVCVCGKPANAIVRIWRD